MTNSLGPGTRIVGIADVRGATPDTLSFNKGSILVIDRKSADPRWYIGHSINDNRSGYIPAHKVTPYVGASSDQTVDHGEVKLKNTPWFHGFISRQEAEDALLNASYTPDGLYLVRESSHYRGDYTLCVVCQHKVEHYRIMRKAGDLLTIDEDETFATLTDLVQFYKEPDRGLCTRLDRPLIRRDARVFVDVDDFRRNRWCLDKAQLRLGDVVGKGEFGDVYKGTYAGAAVAVKEVHDVTESTQKLLIEASVMTALQHANLVRLIGVILGQPIYLLTEYMALGDLVNYLRSRGRSVISRRQLAAFVRDAAAGMAYLEKERVIHRDLAARNILVSDSEPPVAKVSDFGLARKDEPRRDEATPSGETGKFPIKWTAPEAIRDSRFTTKSDVWSFGVLLWEVYSFGKVPYPRIKLDDVPSMIERGYRMEAPDACSPEVYAMMQACWQMEPTSRPTFAALHAQLETIVANSK